MTGSSDARHAPRPVARAPADMGAGYDHHGVTLNIVHNTVRILPHSMRTASQPRQPLFRRRTLRSLQRESSRATHTNEQPLPTPTSPQDVPETPSPLTHLVKYGADAVPGLLPGEELHVTRADLLDAATQFNTPRGVNVSTIDISFINRLRFQDRTHGPSLQCIRQRQPPARSCCTVSPSGHSRVDITWVRAARHPRVVIVPDLAATTAPSHSK